MLSIFLGGPIGPSRPVWGHVLVSLYHSRGWGRPGTRTARSVQYDACSFGAQNNRECPEVFSSHLRFSTKENRHSTKENRHFFCIFFLIFSVHVENGLRWPQMGRGGFFPTNPDLANILGRTDLIFEMFYCFFDFLDPKILNFQVRRSQNFWISRSPDLQIPKIPDFQVPRFPDAAYAGRILRSQPDPSPNAPRDQIRRKGPCCDVCMCVQSTCTVYKTWNS